ncbi:MAG TPA: hypothetical protein VF519_04440 [Mycobacteriales bacterium]|jgi:hypothetical protein
MLRRLVLAALVCAAVVPSGAASAALLEYCSGSDYSHGFVVSNPLGGSNPRFCIVN